MNEKLYIIVEKLPKPDSSRVDILSALLVPCITIIGAIIAFQQYQINRQRLRHELYERRLVVYRAIQKYLSEITREGKTTYERVSQFYAEASEAFFLFDDSVQLSIDEIYNKSVRMIQQHNKLYPPDNSPGFPVGEDRSKVSAENAQLLKWHMDQLFITKNLFAKKWV